MRALAIILARGGSKGVPHKNTRQVGGKPCIAWTIEQARRAIRVERVLVSTDDDNGKAIAEDLGAEVTGRPQELAGDTARVDDAARHALDASDVGRDAKHTGPVVILYANVPLRPEGLIDRALELLETTGCDSVQSYAPVGKHHPWWTAKLSTGGEGGDEGIVTPWEGKVLNHGVFRRQDLPPAFVPDGGVIALTPAALRLQVPGVPQGPHAFFGLDRRGIQTGEGEVIDIDSEIDLLVADAVLKDRSK